MTTTAAPPRPQPTRGYGYTIKLSRGRFFWRALVTTIGVMHPETMPTFHARSEQRAREKAERWCKRHHARRTELSVYRYQPERDPGK